MYLSKIPVALMVFSAFPACGPEAPNTDRLIGTFSNRGAGSFTKDSRLAHYEIREDGTFVIVRVGSDAGGRCNNVRETLAQYSWKPYGEDEIEVSFPDGSRGNVEAWRISLGPECSIRVRSVQEGMVSTNASEYTRGAVCREVPPCPEGEVCECNTVWCDEPPPPCDGT